MTPTDPPELPDHDLPEQPEQRNPAFPFGEEEADFDADDWDEEKEPEDDPIPDDTLLGDKKGYNPHDHRLPVVGDVPAPPALSNENQIEKELAEMKLEIEQLRRQSRLEPREYQQLKQDETYRILFEKGDLRLGDEEFYINRIYPSLEQQEKILKERKKILQAEKRKKPAIPTNIRIKEFTKDPELVKAEVETLKRGPANPGLIELLPKLKEELPAYKQDVEKFIGENLVSKLAAVVIVVGIIVLFNYGISTGFISSSMRFGVGVLLGLALFGLSYFAVSKKKAFPELLASLGALVSYYTIYLGYSEYYLLPQIGAFAEMLVITGLCLWMAAKFNAQMLAITGLVGGVAIPVLLNDGSGNPAVFSGYISLLTGVVLFIGHRQQWKATRIMSYLLLAVYLIMWPKTARFLSQPAWSAYLFFSTAYFLLFYLSHLYEGLRRKADFTRLDLIIMIGLSLLFSYAFYRAANQFGLEQPLGKVFLGLGLLNTAYAYIVHYRRQLHPETYWGLQLMAWGFGTGSLLILGSSVYLNVFLAAETLLLLWLGQQLANAQLKSFATYTLFLAVYNMLAIWLEVYWPPAEQLPFLFNRAVAAGTVTLSLVSILLLLMQEDQEEAPIAFLEKVAYRQLLGNVLFFSTYICLLLELLQHTQAQTEGGSLRTLTITLYNLLFAHGYRYVIYRFQAQAQRSFSGVLIVLAVVGYLLLGFNAAANLRAVTLGGGAFWLFGMHYLATAYALYLTHQLIRDVVSSEGYTGSRYPWAVRLMAVLLVVTISFELESTLLLYAGEASAEKLQQVRLTGYTVLWSLTSLAFMYYGMARKVREWRVISLALLLITVVKYFIFDFWQLTVLWRILSILFLGLLLWLISRMYSQLKNMIKLGKIPFDRDAILSQAEATKLMQYIRQKKKEDE